MKTGPGPHSLSPLHSPSNTEAPFEGLDTKIQIFSHRNIFSCPRVIVCFGNIPRH